MSVTARSTCGSVGANSLAVRYAPCANDAPNRSPMIGVTPPPASKTGVECGFAVTPATEIRTGAEFVTPTRASHLEVDAIATAASGYVDAIAGTRALPVSNGSIGVK